MRSAAAFLCLLAAACSEQDRAWITLPPLEGASHLILAVAQEGRLDATVFDLSAGPPSLSLPFDAQNKVAQLGAYVYDMPLPLPAGRLQLATSDQSSTTIPAADRTYGAEIRGTEVSGWDNSRSPGPEIRLPRSQREDCFSFDFENIPFGTERPSFILTLNNEAALFAVENKLGIVDDRGAEEIANPIGDRVLAGAIDSESETVWLAGSRGSVWHGPRELPLTLTRVRSTTIAQPLFIAGGFGANGEPEIFVSARDGRVFRYSGGVEEALHRFDVSTQIFDAGGIVRGAPGVAVAVSISSPQVVAYFSPSVTLEEPQPGFNQGLGALVNTDTLGFVVATTRGRILRRNETWALIAESEEQADILALEPYQGSLLAAGRFGFFAQITAQGFCPVQGVGAEPLVDLAIAGDDPILVPGGPAPDGRYYFRRLHRR